MLNVNSIWNTKVFGLMPSAILVVVVVFVPSAASTVVLARGPCPTVGTQHNFNMTAFLGQWYELKSFESGTAACISTRYLDNNNGTYSVENNGFALSRRVKGGPVVRYPVSLVGLAHTPDPLSPADLLLDFGDGASSSKDPNYSVAATDYSTYAVVFSCTHIPGRNLNMHGAWILTRERGIPPKNLAMLEAALAQAGVSVSSFNMSDQTNCSTTQL